MTATFGPWAPGLDDAERKARCRALRAVAMMYIGHHIPFFDIIKAAEDDPAYLKPAYIVFEEIPTLTIRKILASYAKTESPQPWEKARSQTSPGIQADTETQHSSPKPDVQS